MQHVAPQQQREVTRKKAGLFGAIVTTTYTIKAHGGFAIKHKPERPSPALNPNPFASWVHWKDTDGARRRKWA